MFLRIKSPECGREIIIAQSGIVEGNMSLKKGEISDTIENRKRFLHRMGLSVDELVVPGLVHGSEVRRADDRERGQGAFSLGDAFPDTDGVVTSEPGLILAVTTADCLPVLIWDDRHSVIGAAHAGWKGLAGGIILNLVDAARSLSDAEAAGLNALIGVSIGRCCYTVDEARLNAFSDLPRDEISVFHKGELHLDLKKTACMMLERAGLSPEKISVSPVCSACGEGYPSYRRDGEGFAPDLALITITNTERGGFADG